MSLIWCSDIHLNFLEPLRRVHFYSRLRYTKGNKILITGDIAESHNLELILEEMQRYTNKKIYFVAGNHDYYRGSIHDMRNRMKKYRCATYLPKRFGYKIGRDTWLTGVDGWGDCRNGDPHAGRLRMPDWTYIDELKTESEPPVKALQKYADADATRLCKNVLQCIDKGAKKIVIATHVPPFEEVCLYAGKKSEPYGLPFFSSKILGFSLLPVIEDHSGIKFVWLCGHTHSSCTVDKRPNLSVQVAGAQYGVPQIEGAIT